MILHTVPRSLYNAATLVRAIGHAPLLLTENKDDEVPVPALARWGYRLLHASYSSRDENWHKQSYIIIGHPDQYLDKASLRADQEAWDAWWAALNADIIYPQDGPEL